jgi:hypothetical protein
MCPSCRKGLSGTSSAYSKAAHPSMSSAVTSASLASSCFHLGVALPTCVHQGCHAKLVSRIHMCALSQQLPRNLRVVLIRVTGVHQGSPARFVSRVHFCALGQQLPHCTRVHSTGLHQGCRAILTGTNSRKSCLLGFHILMYQTPNH